ncbi:MAG TPA: metallopeptidase TldD-related protein, partial [Polyangiaceae bacterium]|nr:metallopeptidase TldD-related protein [Polyangiaceae bacterium]
MRRNSWCVGVALLLAWPCTAIADEATQTDPVMKALLDELQRTPQLAVPGAPAPYYVALRVADSHVFEVEATFGALVVSQGFPDRRLFADVRVGSYEHDNGNFEPDRAWSDYFDQSRTTLPFENDYDAVRRGAWLASDAGYKAALRALGQKVAVQTREQTSPDRGASFSHEPETQTIDARTVPPMDRARFEQLAKDLSAVGRSSAHLDTAVASVSGATGRRLFVSTEGSRVIEPRARLQLSVVLRTQADDGMQLAHFLVLGACKAERLPADGVLQATIQHIAQQLEQVRQAPLAEDYTGPVLFEGIAAPQLISELLADEVSGTPPEQSADGSPSRPDSQLSSQLGQRIFPTGYTLVDDPTIDHLGQTPLAGCYAVDDEGVTAQKVTL